MSSKSKSKTQQAKASKEQAAVVKASGLDLAKAGAALNAAKISITKTLAEIDSQLVEKIGDLEAINTTIELKKKEIAELHGADQVLRSIDELRVELEEKKAETAKAILTLEDVEAQEQAARSEARRREEEHYNYSLSQQRKAENDTWNEQVRVRNNQERDRAEMLDKGWKEREAILGKQEKEYFQALEKFKTFDAEVDKKVKEEVAKIAGAMKKDYEHEKKITEVQHAAQLSNMSKDLQAKDLQLVTLVGELQDVKLQLKTALEAQTTLAKATVDAAANSKAQADAMAVFTNVAGGNGARRAGA